MSTPYARKPKDECPFDLFDANIVRIFKTLLMYAVKDEANAIHIVKHTQKGTVSYRLRQDEMLHEQMRLPLHAMDPLIAWFQQIATRQGGILFKLKGKEYQGIVEMQESDTVTQMVITLQTIIKQERALVRSEDTIPLEDVRQINHVLGWNVDATKRFLAQTSSLRYDRLVAAAKYAISENPEKKKYWLHDPIEDDTEFVSIIKQAHAEAKEKSNGDERGIAFWHRKHCILRDKYNVEWLTPIEMNPNFSEWVRANLRRLNNGSERAPEYAL